MLVSKPDIFYFFIYYLMINLYMCFLLCLAAWKVHSDDFDCCVQLESSASDVYQREDGSPWMACDRAHGEGSLRVFL